MKKVTIAIMIAVAMMTLVTVQASAAPVKDADALLSAFAEVSTIHTLQVAKKNIADDSTADAINFGTINGNANKLAPQYLEVTFASNEATWGINIWSDSSLEPNAANKEYSTGGLYSDTAKKRVNIVWQAASAKLSLTDPTNPGSNWPWTFVLGKKNIDDPDTADVDESFNGQYTKYARIVSGLGTDALYGNGQPATTPMYVYLGAMFSLDKATPGTYGCTLGLDLYHE